MTSGSRLRPLLLAGIAASGLLCLAWYDLIPGGWTLRGWVLPHAVRQAHEQAQRSRERLRLFRGENPHLAPGSIVFLGSSTIERFPLGTEFPGKPAVNRGIGNETATELLARLDASLPAAPPAAAVLYAGSLDFRREHRPPQVTRKRVERIVRELRARFPDLPLAVVGLLPEWDFPETEVRALAATNRALEELAAELGLSFIATDRPPITGPDGSLTRACSADRLHLNSTGYEHLARWILEAEGPVARLLSD